MANIDELQIKISASAKEADDAIKSLVSNLNNLNSAIEHLDTSKISSFSSAMSKLANIGSNTNTTAKALKGMANELSSSFGIQTKKGIEDVTVALQALYKASRSVNLNDSPENQDVYWHTVKGLQKAIEENYKYKVAIDDTTKSVLDYVKATNSAGTKIGMADMVKEFGEDFKGMSSVLGKAFKNNLNSSKEGVQDLAEYLNEMNSALGTQFDTVNVEKGFSQLVETIRNAKDVVLDFDQATQKGLLSGEEVANATYDITDRLFALIREQDKYGASSGLGSLAEVFKQISNIQMPDMSGVADALKATQTASNNVGSSAPKVEEVSQAINHVTESANSATQSANELSNALMVISKGVVAPTDGGNFSLSFVQSVEQALPALREISSFQPPDLSTAIEQFNEYADAIYRALAGMRAIEDKRPGLPDKFYDPIDTTGEWVENNPPDIFKGMEKEAEGARRAIESLNDTISQASNVDKAYDYVYQKFADFQRSTNKNLPAVYTNQDSDQWFKTQDKAFEDAAENIEKSAEKIEQAKEKASKGTVSGNVLENIVALGEAFEKLGSKLDAVGDKGIKLFKGLITPLKMAAEEYKEKFENMAENVENFKKSFNAHMAKISQFWKRTMKTFTFMLVRKAITAIIKEVGNAVQSLAMYSNAMGTAFNTDISHMVADFQYLGRSIVSVFAPLLSYIAPIIDAIVDRIATLISYIGMLIAALGGSTSFTKAKKNVGNYAESLDQASKSAKNLTMGIDELNILSEKSGGGGAKPYDGWEDAWEDVKIPEWIKNLSDWLKDLWHKFFDPLKEAWDRAKQYVIDGFKTMVLSLKRLMSDIGRDFFEMWGQEKTIHMFEQIFKMVGDIFRVVRNLADAFDEAWNKGRIGLKIFENLRDIMYNLVEHARNVTYYMIGWAKNIDFSPLLESFEKLTNSLKRVADFIGGVFEDIMIDGVLKYVEFMIEEGVPHMQHTLAEIFDAFSFTELRKNLKIIWSAFEEMFENIHVGTTNAIGNLGKEVAKFTKSKEFTDFLQRIVDVTRLITRERVEKVLTGLGKGVLAIAKAVVKFVNSKLFMGFLEFLAAWIDNHSVDQIARILTDIANVILIFKFGAFAAEKVSGFFKFFTILTALGNLGTIASSLTGIGKALGTVGEGAGAVAATSGGLSGFGGILGKISGVLSGLVPIVGSVITAFLEFRGVSESVEKLTHILDGGDGSLGFTIGELVAKVGLAAGAFTLLLGFPAGVIAAGCVAAVAAIKGINDAVNEINFDHVTDAILTQGDTTVDQVRRWYEDTTSVVVENCQIWKNTERDLVQGRDDIDAYAKSIEGLQSAFSSNVQATVGMGDQIIGIYGDMGASISHYIDESTNAMVNNLEAQRGYLESTGHDVDEMIAQLLVGADKQKEAVTTAHDNMKQAQEAYSDAVEKYGEESAEAKAKYQELKDVINESSSVYEQFQSKVNEVDTSPAIEQITKLGKSLDLSQYDYEGGWDDAVNAISTSIQDIKNTTESGLQEINETYQQKIDELNDYREKNPFMTEEYYKVEMDAIVSQWATDRETLITAAEQSLDLYDQSLALKLQDVAANAEQNWENTNPFKRFFTMGTDKDAYVYSQMQNYVNEHLGDSGLTGLINDAYSVIPDHVRPSATQSMSTLVNDTAEAYRKATYGIEDYTTQSAVGTYQNVVNAIPGLVEYDTSNKAFIDRQMNAAKLAAEGAHYDEISGVLVDKTGNALIEKSADLEAYNRMLAGNGVMAMSDEYKEQLSGQAELFEAVKAFGQDIPKGVVQGIDEEVANGTVLDSIESIFKPIPDFIHDLPFFPFGSPNLKMKEYGKDTVMGYNAGIDENRTTTGTPLSTWFSFINGEVTRHMATLKGLFNSKIVETFNGSGADLTGAFTTLFSNVTTMLTTKMTELGDYLLGTLMPNFITTYLTPAFDLLVVWFDEVAMLSWWDEHLLPWFATEKWDADIFTPLKENIEIHYLAFIEWWDQSIEDWWNSHLVDPWFTNDKWDSDIFTPLKENIYDHFKKFIEWWDTSITDWWDKHLMPWIEKWLKTIKEVGNITMDDAEEVFSRVQESITKHINEAKDAVLSACVEMKQAIDDVLTAIGQVMEALSGFGGFSGDVTFSFGVPQMASGGFPAYGSLFIAGEPGAGTEWVGNVGGRTGVVSNNEITGIADAVYATGNAETELLGQLLSIGRAMLDKDPIVINDKDIAKMANRGQSQLGMSIIS